MDLHRTHEPVARRGKAAKEPFIAALLLPGDFLAVGVGEDNGQLAAWKQFVIVGLLIDAKADAFGIRSSGLACKSRDR